MASSSDYERRDVAGSVDPLVDLRKRALDKALERKGGHTESSPPEQAQFLLEELRIHQIELEMQNEELRRVQAELETSRLRYFDLYNLAPAGYLSLDSNGVIIEANLRASTLLATLRSSLTLRKFSRYIAVESKETYELTRLRLLQTGEAANCEVRIVRPNGPLFWARLELSVGDDDHSRIFRIVIVDIDEQRRLAEALREANLQLTVEKRVAEDATRAKSLFLSSMSHEIRTPLNGVVGMANLLLQTEMSGEQSSYARIVSESAEALLGLVNNILDFSKIEAGQVELDETPFDLECLIEDVIDIMSFRAHDKSLEVACWYPASAQRYFIGDSGRLRQILMNFISNSIKFTQSGYVLVEVETEEMSKDRCNVRIAIHDTGIGISKENLRHLFKRFRQADSSIARLFGGTGLGLSIVKQIVELMRGELNVSSIEGEGSTFSCKIPLKVDLARPKTAPDTVVLQGLRVMVSGSHQISRFVIAEWCERWGMEVAQCDLVCLVRNLATASQNSHSFQMVIIDAGINALATFVADLRLAVGTPLPKIVFLTPDSLEKANELGADAVLSTPVRAKSLGETLGQLVAGTSDLKPARGSAITTLPAYSPALKDLKVLVTDDNLVNRKLACALLSRLGCDVDTADDGEQAVNKASKTKYGLIFMDCVMPGMDGFAATTAIRKLAGTHGSVPIVALTASATIEDRDHCLAVGMNDFLTKPIRSEQLSSCLTKWLRRPGGKQAARGAY